MYSTRQMVRKKKQFLFKIGVNYFDQLFHPVISFLVQTPHFRDYRIPKDQI